VTVPERPLFLSKELVVAIHSAQIDEHGGILGIRDEGLLDSALAQPMASFGGEFLHGDVFEMAAAYLFHIAMNHPFLDGNKRTGLAAALVFLEGNGVRIRDSGMGLADMVLEMTTDHRDKAWVADRLRERADPIEK